MVFFLKSNSGPQDVLDFDPLQPSEPVVAEGGGDGGSSALAVELDQVLNLAEAKETKTSDANSVPIIAFEEKKEPPVAGILASFICIIEPLYYSFCFYLQICCRRRFMQSPMYSSLTNQQ